jgi:hypothetical protein
MMEHVWEKVFTKLALNRYCCKNCQSILEKHLLIESYQWILYSFNKDGNDNGYIIWDSFIDPIPLSCSEIILKSIL